MEKYNCILYSTRHVRVSKQRLDSLSKSDVPQQITVQTDAARQC